MKKFHSINPSLCFFPQLFAFEQPVMQAKSVLISFRFNHPTINLDNLKSNKNLITFGIILCVGLIYPNNSNYLFMYFVCVNSNYKYHYYYLIRLCSLPFSFVVRSQSSPIWLSLPSKCLEQQSHIEIPILIEIEVPHQRVDLLVSQIKSKLLQSNNDFIKVDISFALLVNNLNECH